MTNAEYPDLPFIPPAAFGTGRPMANTPRVIVIHYTAGAERNTSAEDGAAYDQRRTDGTSTHYFVDSDSVVQCVYTWDRANAAFYNGNRIGIQYELCGTQQTRAQWLDTVSDATLRNAARQAARDAAKYGIPVVKLTPAQVAAGEKGLCGHADITLAFPSDGGDHMDPGTEFPWDVFLNYVKGGEDDMDAKQNERLVWTDGRMASTADMTDNYVDPAGKSHPNQLVAAVKAMRADVAAVKASESASVAAVQALTETINKLAAGTGGQLDAAPIVAAINAAGEKESAAVTALNQQIATMSAQIAAYRQAEAKAAQALADELHG